VTDEERKRGAILHIVHDWSMLVRLMDNPHPKPSPLNHATERAFLVECRKFANFFRNNRGPRKEDAISKDFVSQHFKPKLPVWKKWHEHINRQLMHLSYARVENTEDWDGSANAPIYVEFQDTWAKFLPCIDPKYKTEFDKQLKIRGF
jgi:hypothetical protein